MTDSQVFAAPNTEGAIVNFKTQYENYIGGEWVAPVKGEYFDSTSPVNGGLICRIPKSSAGDIDLAVAAATEAQKTWGKTSPSERSNMLLQMRQVMIDNHESLAVAESWGNGKSVRESLAADLPLAEEHLKYFAGAIDTDEGSYTKLDATRTSVIVNEPIGVVGQIIPWNFPLLMMIWKIAPALAAGCSIVLKPAEQTPATALMFAELIDGILPPGVLNIVNGYGEEAGAALVEHPGISKIAFTGSTSVGRHIAKTAGERLIPATVELGGKSPNIICEDVMKQSQSFIDKAVEGFVLGFLNQGEVCTCNSRQLIQESIYKEFMPLVNDCMERTIKRGNPLDLSTSVGAQVSSVQKDQIMEYINIAKAEGAEVLTGGNVQEVPKEFGGGHYVEATVLKGDNSMRVFQEEVFGPVLAVTTFKDIDEAIEIANDTTYGLGAGVWTKDMNIAARLQDEVQAGRIWVNCYHDYSAHAPFGGFKQSGIGRETHKMALNNYRQTKSIITSTSDEPLGFFHK